MNVPIKPTDKASLAIHTASSLPIIAVADPVKEQWSLNLTRVNELSDSFNKGLIEYDTSSNTADSHNSHEQPKRQLEIHTSWNSDF